MVVLWSVSWRLANYRYKQDIVFPGSFLQEKWVIFLFCIDFLKFMSLDELIGLGLLRGLVDSYGLSTSQTLI